MNRIGQRGLAHIQAWVQAVGNGSKTVAQQNLPILGIFLLVSAIAFVQSLPQFASALIGQDSSATIWNFWWLRRALWLNFDIMITDHTVFPFQQNQLLSLSPLCSLLFGLLTGMAIAPPLAFNLLYFLSLIFTGWAMWRYLSHRQLPQPIILLIAVLFTFSPLVVAHVRQGRPDLLALGWIPLGCLVIDQIHAAATRQRGINLFLVGWGSLLTSFTVGTLSFAVWLPYWGYRLWQAKASDRPLVIDQVLFQSLLLLAVCMTYPLPGVLKTFGNLAPEVMPPPLPPELLTPTTGLVLLCLTWLLLAAIALINPQGGTERWFWASLTLVLVGGTLVSQFSGFLARSLFSTADGLIPVSFTLCLLIATSLTRFWQHQMATTTAPLLVVAMLIAVIAMQTAPPTLPWRDTAVYQAIGREGGDYTILDIPFGVRSLITRQTLGTGADFEQYAAVHHKRTLVGTLTRSGQDVFAAYNRSALFQYFAGEAKSVAPDFTATLQSAIQENRIGYVIAHPVQLKEKGQIDRLDFLNSQPSLCKVFESPTAIAYRTAWHPFPCDKLLP